MRPEDEMRKILDAFDEKMGDSLNWTPAALVLLETWLKETEIWVHEGYIAHDDKENAD
jgi:hypothetical protein